MKLEVGKFYNYQDTKCIYLHTDRGLYHIFWDTFKLKLITLLLSEAQQIKEWQEPGQDAKKGYPTSEQIHSFDNAVIHELIKKQQRQIDELRERLVMLEEAHNLMYTLLHQNETDKDTNKRAVEVEGYVLVNLHEQGSFDCIAHRVTGLNCNGRIFDTIEEAKNNDHGWYVHPRKIKIRCESEEV